MALLKIDTLTARQFYNTFTNGLSAQEKRTMLRGIRTEGVTKAAEAAGIPLDLRRKRSA